MIYNNNITVEEQINIRKIANYLYKNKNDYIDINNRKCHVTDTKGNSIDFDISDLNLRYNFFINNGIFSKIEDGKYRLSKEYLKHLNKIYRLTPKQKHLIDYYCKLPNKNKERCIIKKENNDGYRIANLFKTMGKSPYEELPISIQKESGILDSRTVNSLINREILIPLYDGGGIAVYKYLHKNGYME